MTNTTKSFADNPPPTAPTVYATPIEVHAIPVEAILSQPATDAYYAPADQYNGGQQYNGGVKSAITLEITLPLGIEYTRNCKHIMVKRGEKCAPENFGVPIELCCSNVQFLFRSAGAGAGTS